MSFLAIATVFNALVATGVGIVAVRISNQQKRLNDVQVQNAIFERRYKVFDAARALMLEATKNRPVAIEPLNDFFIATSPARFFFGTRVLGYLDLIRQKVVRLNLLHAHIDFPGPLPPSGVNLSNMIAEKTQFLNWFVAQIQKESAEVFALEMALDRPVYDAFEPEKFWSGT